MRPDDLPVPPPPVTPLRWVGGWRDGALDLLDQIVVKVDLLHRLAEQRIQMNGQIVAKLRPRRTGV